MKLKFIHSGAVEKNLKATVHKSGKLGFTTEAAKKLNLIKNKGFGISVNEDDPSDKNLYVHLKEVRGDGFFPVSKAGDYYYVNSKALFDNMKEDYVNETIIYDISEMEVEGQKIFKFKRREKANKKAI